MGRAINRSGEPEIQETVSTWAGCKRKTRITAVVMGRLIVNRRKRM
jgi:hypothetical protein